MEPNREQPGRGFAAPHIELHLTVGSKTAGALERAAAALAGRLVELVEVEQPLVGVGELARPVTYGDIAILYRAIDQAEQRLHELPYNLSQAGQPGVAPSMFSTARRVDGPLSNLRPTPCAAKLNWSSTWLEQTTWSR